MNHCVPDFDMDKEDYSIPTSSTLSRHKNLPADEIMELLWENGQVVVQTQNHQALRKSSHPPPTSPPPPPSETAPATTLYMQEYEMAAWLHMPPEVDHDLYADLLYTPPPPRPLSIPPPSSSGAADTRTPPQLPSIARPTVPPLSRNKNFPHFSRVMKRVPEQPEASSHEGKESTMVGSGVTPMAAAAGTLESCELMVTSSSSKSGESATEKAATLVVAAERKRKRRDGEEDSRESEVLETQYTEVKKQSHGSTSGKRTRAAEVHNLSERRRRDRINEKMKTLQELIPCCNKTDKASMLDEAIEYLKSLQLQVQMMSMGCSIVPMMYPGMQQYMPPMGMGMGMGMGMHRPMMPFPTPTAVPHIAPRFPLHGPFPMPSVTAADLSTTQASNQAGVSSNSMGLPGHSMVRIPGVVDPYQQYLAWQQIQNQLGCQPSTSKPSSSKSGEDYKNHPTGSELWQIG